MIPAFVWEYKLILRFIIRVSSHLKEALCVFGGSTIQEFTVISLMKFEDPNSRVEPICLITICDKNIYETIKNVF